MDEILNRIEKVTRSDWTGDFYISPADALGDMHTGIPSVVFYGEMATDELHDAIYEMIQTWPYVELWEQGCCEYTRPKQG